jgi:hypothetical protein
MTLKIEKSSGMRKRLFVSLFLYLWCVNSPMTFCVAQSPSLSTVVLFSNCSVTELDASTYPEAMRECVTAYLNAIPAGSPLWKWQTPDDQTKALDSRRSNMEQQIVLLLGNTVAAQAKEFSKAMPLGLEWEGMWEGPLGEADFIAQWLEKYSSTPLEPFLHLFMAHRLRAAYEAARMEGGNKGLIPILAERYKKHITAALNSSNTLISCIARDLEEQQYVYLPEMGRP